MRVRILRKFLVHKLPTVIALGVLVVAITASSAQTVTTLHSFTSVGSYPANVALAQGRDGWLYGTTELGGAHNLGGIFKIDTSGKFRWLYSFGGTDGSYPWGGLMLAKDGSFYGTTSQGGVAGYGVIFKVTPAGVVTVLHDFEGPPSDGAFSDSPPIEALDGNFYGTSYWGGSNLGGIVYRLTHEGAYSIIYNYADPQGSYDEFSPVQGSDGNLYIPSTEGGANECGSVNKISTAGVLRDTYSFDCAANGGNPVAGLMEGSDGEFYGVTYNGGTHSSGLLFKMSKTFIFTPVYSFGATSNDSSRPNAGVFQATDGNLYSSTVEGGKFGKGAIYEFSSNGTLSTLYSWNALADPFGTLTQHTNGNLYGDTYYGGTANRGTVYSLNVGLGPFVTTVGPSGKVGGTVQVLGQGFKGTTSVTFNGVAAASFTVVSDTFMTAAIPTGATTGPVVVATPTGTLTSNKAFRITH